MVMAAFCAASQSRVSAPSLQYSGSIRVNPGQSGSVQVHPGQSEKNLVLTLLCLSARYGAKRVNVVKQKFTMTKFAPVNVCLPLIVVASLQGNNTGPAILHFDFTVQGSDCRGSMFNREF
jgi:hypothetical protein